MFFDDKEYGEYQQNGDEHNQALQERESEEIVEFVHFLKSLV